MSVQVLLQDKINKIMADTPELKLSGKNEFEIAVAQILNLKFFTGLDFEDLLDGIIGNGGDEGIDLCYLFVNDLMISEFDETTINKSSSIRLEIGQAKKVNGFSTTGFDKFCQGVLEIFTLKSQDFKVIGANEDLIKRANLIRDVFRDANTKGATFSLRLHYATIGETDDLPPKIKFYQDKLKEDLKWASFKEINYELWGAQELNEIALKKDDIIDIEFTDLPLDLSESESTIKGFAGFVQGGKFIESLLDENKRLRDELTEGNIRFFYGEDDDVNSEIIKTASGDKAENFWAMNNGISIIAERISPKSKNIKIIQNPQIVNGCQTTHCLYETYKKAGNKINPKLKLFVKIIETIDPDIQQNIISATNSQIPVAIASLKANDDIQKNIQQYLEKYHIYYERRAMFYKRKGKTGLSVFSMMKMAQIMHTVFSKEAIRAVNHTKDLFRDKDLYSRIFTNSADLDSYVFASKLYQKIGGIKNSDLRTNKYSPEIKELKSKSLFCLLHISSSLLLKTIDKIDIAQPIKHKGISKIYGMRNIFHLS